ncbi:MAG: peroxiredoxin family protein [Flavobacteriales bacterium]
MQLHFYFYSLLLVSQFSLAQYNTDSVEQDPIRQIHVESGQTKASHNTHISSQSYSTTFPDYTFTDINGQSHNLYEQLNDGKAVLLSFMSPYSLECKNEVQYLNHIHEVYQEQHDVLYQIGIEFSNTPIDLVELNEDWQIHYPLVNLSGLDAFLDDIITQSPTYIFIAPDKSYQVTSNFSNDPDYLSVLNQGILEALDFDTMYDLDLYKVDFNACNGTNSIVLDVQNTGTSILSNGFDVEISSPNGFYDLFTVSNTLNPKSRLAISLYYTSNDIGDSIVDINLIPNQSNENELNNTAAITLTETNASSGTSIRIELQTDNYPEETAWHLIDNTLGSYIDSAGLGANGTIVGLAGGLHIYEFALEANHCYTFQVYDSYGDGLCCSNGEGSFKILDNLTNTVLNSGSSFQLSETLGFKTIPSIGVDDVNMTSNSTSKLKHTNYINLLGQQVSEPKTNQIYIKQDVFEDGNIKNRKILFK